MCFPFCHRYKSIDVSHGKSTRQGYYHSVTFVMLQCQKCGVVKSRELDGTFSIEAIQSAEEAEWLERAVK